MRPVSRGVVRRGSREQDARIGAGLDEWLYMTNFKREKNEFCISLDITSKRYYFPFGIPLLNTLFLTLDFTFRACGAGLSNFGKLLSERELKQKKQMAKRCGLRLDATALPKNK